MLQTQHHIRIEYLREPVWKHAAKLLAAVLSTCGWEWSACCIYGLYGWRMFLSQRDFPDGYTDALATLKSLIHDSQHRAQLTVNTALVELYWSIETIILKRRADYPWGSNVLDRVARDLRKEFLNMKGSSRTNPYSTRLSQQHGLVKNQLSRHRLDD